MHMEVFFSTLNQMGILFTFIVIGYLLMKFGGFPAESATILSKLENVLLIPALVMGTFMENFTVEKLSTSVTMLASSLVLSAVAIPLAIVLARLCSREDLYIRKIYTYGLAFANFSFMGNAVVNAVFPEIFMEYLIFTLPLWMLIYVWGVPALLIPDSGTKPTLREKVKNFLNPMVFGMLAGMAIGYFSIPVPGFFLKAVNTLGSCMSPVAMLLTGMTIAMVDARKVFGTIGIYQVSFLRLILLPLFFIGVLAFLPIPDTVFICAICAVAMPLGLNSIVVPNAYGQDTSIAAGMTVVSHLASCVTIPLIFLLIMRII